MIRPCEVRITSRAERDLKRIFSWLKQRSPDGARRWKNAAYEAIYSLDRSPERWGLAPESKHSDVEIRNRFFSTHKGRIYRAVYFIEESVVYITHVRGPGQNNIPRRELP